MPIGLYSKFKMLNLSNTSFCSPLYSHYFNIKFINLKGFCTSHPLTNSCLHKLFTFIYVEPFPVFFTLHFFFIKSLGFRNIELTVVLKLPTLCHHKVNKFQKQKKLRKVILPSPIQKAISYFIKYPTSSGGIVKLLECLKMPAIYFTQ